MWIYPLPYQVDEVVQVANQAAQPAARGHPIRALARKTWPGLPFFAVAAVLVVGPRLLGF